MSEASDGAKRGEARVSGPGVLRQEISKLPTGERAELRRQPGTSLAFYKLRSLLFSTVRRPETLAKWITLVQATAILNELYSTEVSFGAGLARAGLSELRLTRLLRARDTFLHRQVIASARFLKAKGVSHDLWGIFDLVHKSEHGSQAAERARQRIAGDYFDELTRQGQPNQEATI
ncbi:MAG: type I-E CRISPR-associated protein Cse2/CasB [Myxococcota bacterium]